MPWHVIKSKRCPKSKPWGVINELDGTLEGCHATHKHANKQLAALYAKDPASNYQPRPAGTPCRRRPFYIIDADPDHCQQRVSDCLHQCMGWAGHAGDCYD